MAVNLALTLFVTKHRSFHARLKRSWKNPETFVPGRNYEIRLTQSTNTRDHGEIMH